MLYVVMYMYCRVLNYVRVQGWMQYSDMTYSACVIIMGKQRMYPWPHTNIRYGIGIYQIGIRPVILINPGYVTQLMLIITVSPVISSISIMDTDEYMPE